MMLNSALNHYKRTAATKEKSIEDESTMIRQFIPLIESVIKRFQHVSDVFDSEDFSQLCLIELVNIIRKNEQDIQSNEFKSYFKQRCKYVILENIRSSNIITHYGQKVKAKHDKAMKQAINKFGRPVTDHKLVELGWITEKEIRLLYWNAEFDIKESFDEVMHEILANNQDTEVVIALNEAIHTLSKEEQILLKLLYVDDLSQTEVAQVMKAKTQQVISYKLKGIYQKLGECLSNEPRSG
ncbi:sigma-70 family RNA polymerase sigma factor [Vibrio sp.]|nr:sigma-70 family RNA polymerase sigma factor [Vibrio sp.]